MSEISLYPQYIDTFDKNVNATSADDSREEVIIYAEDMNKVQNAVVAIEGVLGETPNGEYTTIAKAISTLGKNKPFSLPKVSIYSGNPINVNGCTTAANASTYFNFMSIVILDDIDWYSAVADDAANVIAAASNVKFYAAIDAGVSTSNLSTTDVSAIVAQCKTKGIKGVYFKNFGYDYNVNRERQNTFIDIVHNAGLNVIVSSTYIDHIFSIDNISSMNQSNTEISLVSGDAYLALGYGIQGSSYQNAAELVTLSQKMVDYRSAYGVSMYGLSYINGTDNDKAQKYYYAQAVAALYSLDALYAVESTIAATTMYFYKDIAISGSYRSKNPVVVVNNNVGTRMTDIGRISVDFTNHTYSFSEMKIPFNFVDMGDSNATIDAAKLTGSIPSNVSIDVINRINNDLSGLTISSNKVDVSGTKVIDAINLVAAGTTKIDAQAVNELSSAHIEDAVIQALADSLQDNLLSGTLSANFRKLMAQYISAQNAYFSTIKSETGTFGGLNAGYITAGFLDADLINTDTITSDKLTIAANGGVNKWVGTVVRKDAGVITSPGRSNIVGKDVYRTIEAVDSTGLNTNEYIGSSLINYVVMWETNVFCTTAYQRTSELTANSYTKLALNDADIVTVAPNGTAQFTLNFREGWNKVQIYQDHNAETSCSFNIGIKFSTYALQTENKTNVTPITRMDAYASKVTQIIGDLIKTGTIDATKIIANSITAGQIKSGTITTTQLDADEVAAGLVDVGMLQAVEAYIQKLNVTEGEFEKVLAELLTTKFIDTSNIKVVSEANDGTNPGQLVIDNGGLIVSAQPKAKVAVTGETMSAVSTGVYRVTAKYTGMPICETPAPVFYLKDKTTLVSTVIPRDSYTLIYEYGQIAISDTSILANKDVIADYSYPEQYYPSGIRVVKIDREGIKISSDGGRPGTWTTKLDGSRLYVGEADISEASITNAMIKDGVIQHAKIGSVDASTISTGTLTASESVAITAGGTAITLDERGLTSSNFTIGTDGNVSITGTLTAKTGSKIANWFIGENTIYDLYSKIVLDSSIPSINIDGGKVVLGLYDGTNYGISAKSGFFGTTANKIIIDDKGLVLGTGSIVDTRDSALQNLYISSNGIIAGNINATSGTINGIQITPEGLQAFSAPAAADIIQNITNITEHTTVENNEYITNNYYLQPNAIRVRGDESVIIDTGTLVVKDDVSVNRVVLGKLAEAIYGLKLDLLEGKYIQLDKNGMRVFNGTIDTININSTGDVTITGEINAQTGTLGTLTVNGTITAGDTTINTTGISGTGYSLDSNGLVTSKGSIAGWAIGSTSISKGTMTIDSANEKITTTGAIFGQYETGKYGAKLDTGKIGGWTIADNALSTVNVSIDSAAELIDISSEVLIGKYDTVTPKYGIKAGDVVLDSTGLYGTGYSLNASGLTTTAGSIGGWTINSGSISKNGIVLDSANNKITLGTDKIVLNNTGIGNIGIVQLNKGLNDPTYTNEIENSGFSTTDGWVAGSGSASISVANNTLTINGTGAYPWANAMFTTDKPCATGEKIFVRAICKVTNASTSAIKININGSLSGWPTAVSQSSPVKDQWYTLSTVYTVPSDLTGNIVFVLQQDYADEATATGKIMQAKEVVLVSMGTDSSNPLYNKTADEMNTLLPNWFNGTLDFIYPIYTPNFNIDNDGNVTLTGNVVANSGSFSGIINATSGWFGTEASHVSINGNGLAAGDVTIDNTGVKVGTTLSLNSNGLIITSGSNSSINFGDKFIANKNGITSIAGTIGGWTISSSEIKNSDGTFVLDSTNGTLKIATSKIVLNKDGSATLGAFKVESDGDIYVGTDLATAPFKVTSAGALTSTSGSIGNWIISGSAISAGSIILDATTSGSEHIDIGSKIILNSNSTGNSTIGAFTVNMSTGTIGTSGGFSVDGTTGKLTATQGTIGGFTIGSSTISANTNSVILDASGYKLSFNNDGAIFGQYTTGKYGLKVGNFTVNGTDSTLSAGTNFSINLATGNATLASATLSGSITSTSGSIAGWTLGSTTLSKNNVTLDSSGSIKLGATNQIIIDSTNGINVASGKFTVDLAGHMVAQDAVITGSVTASTGNIGGWVINSDTITAGSITLDSDGIIKAGTTTDRVEINSNGVQVIKNSTVVGSAITPDGIIGQLLTDQSIVGSKFDKTPPAIPTGTTVTQVIEQTATSEFINLNVSWTSVASTDLEGYKVYIKESSTGLYMPAAIVQKDQTSYVIRNVKGNTQYYVAVSAYDVTGNESSKSTDCGIMTTKDTVAPGNISNISFTDGIKMFYVKWTEVTVNDDATTCVDLDHYEVQRKTEQYGAVVEDWTTIYKGYSTSFIDKTVTYDYDYSYRVRAVDLSGNYSASWTQVVAGKPSKVGAADIVAGSITADVLNIGSMVKGINPVKTILFHYDGVATSTQDLRPITTQGGSWVDGKYGDAVALEEATENIISTQTLGNSSFKNGTTGWTVNGGIYYPSGGVGGTEDGYVGLTSANKISITLATVVGKQYTISLYGKLKDFTKPANIIVTANGVEIMDTSLTSEWRRIYYAYTASSTSTVIEFSSSDAYEVCLDNVQAEQRAFMTAYTNSYSIGGTRAEGILQYSSEKLNPKSGIVSMWYRPNRSGASPNTAGQVLFMWGTSGNYYKLEITNDNKPKWTMATNNTVTHSITHTSTVDIGAWNEITVRWSYDPTNDNKFAELYLNGTPNEVVDRIDLSTFTTPTFGNVFFTIGNDNGGGYSCNGYIDEVRIDIEAFLDDPEREEVISWYKQGSTFYDVASQIDADSQGISAANAKVRINNEGISVRDGVIKVISEDGVTLIGGGRLNVNGMNVGVVQSENGAFNGNFAVADTMYGLGDMYVSSAGIQSYGAKWWKSKRSSPFSYSNVVQQAAWAQIIVNRELDWDSIYSMLFTAYNTAIRAQEAATHAIETVIRATEPIASMPAGDAKEALVADTLEDELKYQINTAADSKYDEWVNYSLAALRYNDENGNYKIKIIRYDINNAVLQYVKHSVDPYTGAFYIDQSEIDSSTMLPKLYEATESVGIFGHTQFEVHPTDAYLGKTGYAKLGINTIDEKPTTTVIGVGDGSTTTFTIPGAPLANIIAIAANGTIQVPSVQVATNTLTGSVVFVTAPAAGVIITATYNTIDYSHQYTSIEQNLRDVITYTDGLQEEGTHWKQHVFTFYAKWNSHPVGSQSKVYFEVDELVPKYTVNENNVATIIPTESIVTSTISDQNDFLIKNTDFVNSKYRARIGHAKFPAGYTNYKTYTIDSVRYATALPLLNVRYIKDYSNGNTVNAIDHWYEIRAVDTLGNVVSVGKTVTGSKTPTSGHGLEYVTDGNTSGVDMYTEMSGGPNWVQVDLGQVYNLSAITVWHYYYDTRQYYGTRTQVSADGVKWYDVYNSAYQGVYTEATAGHTIGGVTASIPNPIIVEEVLTAEGESASGKAGWVVNSDGATYSGMTDAKYLSSSKEGDLLMIEFTSESDTDLALGVLEGPSMGMAAIYADGEYIADADTSYPIRAAAKMAYNGNIAGSHRITVIATKDAGYNTTAGTPIFALRNIDIYEWSNAVYTTSIEYNEVDTTSWNKVTVLPNKTNSKDSGTPEITAENVPIKYRARVRFDKPVGDPYSASVYVTGIQAEVGYNESFSRANYGPGSFPASMIQEYNKEVASTGITAQHLQNYNPGFHTKETGIQERHIADGQVTTDKLAASAITADKIAYGNVSYEKLAINKAKLAMNVSLSDYAYPIILATNTDPSIRYIPQEIDIGSESIYVNGQLQFKDEDYTIEHVTAAQRTDDPTKKQLAAKVTFLRTITLTDKVWATYWEPI